LQVLLSPEWLTGSFREVRLSVFQVVVGVHADEFEIGPSEGAADFAGDSGDEGVGWNPRAFGDDSPSRDDAACADVRTVEHNRAHANQDLVFKGAAMDGGVVSDCAHIADDDRVQELHAVEDSTILDVGAGADADVMDIATDDGVHPDAGVFAKDDIADDLGRGVHIACGWNGGSYVSVRTKHG
jgi:hypothetical protein